MWQTFDFIVKDKSLDAGLILDVVHCISSYKAIKRQQTMVVFDHAIYS